MKPIDSGLSLSNKRPDGIIVYKEPVNNIYTIFYEYEKYGSRELDEILTDPKRENIVKYLYNIDTGKIKMKKKKR